jgi:hypothetical protein
MKQCWILYEQKKKKIPKIIKKEALLFVPWKGIPSCFLFRWMVRNRITSVFFYFCSTARNSELFSLLWNGSERNSESFLFRGTAGIPPEVALWTYIFIWLGLNNVSLFTLYPSDSAPFKIFMWHRTKKNLIVSSDKVQAAIPKTVRSSPEGYQEDSELGFGISDKT